MTEYFFRLGPDTILSALDQSGFTTTGEIYPLNSYENRVYEVRLEEPLVSQQSSVVAKFYRPGRWSLAALIDEHQFLQELHNEGVPVNCPLKIDGPLRTQCPTIGEIAGIFFAVCTKHRGRIPDEFLHDEHAQVGRLLAQIHNVGARSRAQHRPAYDAHYVGQALEHIENYIPSHLWNPYLDAAEWLLNAYEQVFARKPIIRIHGDCHRGNLLKNEDGFFFVDFDDFCNGPVEQDFWMLFAAQGEESERELDLLLGGYCELRASPPPNRSDLELLRGLRIIHYSGWVGKRWRDPSFPRLIPDYPTVSYWADELRTLEQIIQRLHGNP